MTFKNMKFKVDSPEQSERVIKVLQSMGYHLYDDMDIHDFLDNPMVYCYEDADITSGADHKAMHEFELQDTAAFLAAHELSPAPSTEQVAIHPEFPWFDNTGTMPDLPEGTKIDIEYKYGGTGEENDPDFYDWSLYGGNYQIVKWRYHRPSDPAEYFVQPKTAFTDLQPSIPDPTVVTHLDGHGNPIDVKNEPKRNKYMREIKPDVWVDVYDVLRAFEVTDPCLQHLLKKALATGKRGHKDVTEDLNDILASAKRAVELNEEWNK